MPQEQKVKISFAPHEFHLLLAWHPPLCVAACAHFALIRFFLAHLLHMGTIAIFPSLSRAASMDSSEQAADDTIRDSMDSGYVATRPRFTRERRTWNVNHRNLIAEDVRVLRNFRAN